MQPTVFARFAAVAGVVSLPLVAAGQSPASGGAAAPARPAGGTKAAAATVKKAWTAKTPWGDPDLQGVWNDATSTPLQRPSDVAGKDILTDEEAASFAEQLAFGLTRDRRDGGTAVDVNRAYNEHWMDARRLKITADHRTSLVVDPADGRIPPLAPLSPEREKARAARNAANGRFNDGLPDQSLALSVQGL